MTPLSDDSNARPSNSRWAATVTVVAIVLAVAFGSSVAKVSRAAMTQSAAAPTAPATGDVRTIPVEITGNAGDVYAAVVLVKDGTSYHRTAEKVSFKVPEGTPYIMGGAPDLKPGGTAQLRGKTENGVLVADRIVILTTSIKVE